MANIKIDKQKIDKAISKAWDNTVDRMSQAMDDAIASDTYQYPRTTKRRNKSVVSSPRDIVDLGNLYDSKSVARSSNGNAAEFSWDVDYAAAMYYGYTTKGGHEVPGRPWVEKAMEETNPQEVFEVQLRQYL